jgi:hypothetical protein
MRKEALTFIYMVDGMEFIFIGECAAFFERDRARSPINVLSLVLTYSPISVSRSNPRIMSYEDLEEPLVASTWADHGMALL